MKFIRVLKASWLVEKINENDWTIKSPDGMYKDENGKEYHFKPMPMKMRTDGDDIEEDSYYQGWNDCIDEILGEQNGDI